MSAGLAARIAGAALGIALVAIPVLTFSCLAHAQVKVAAESRIAQPIIIDDDPGGYVDQALRFYQRIKDSGDPVVLRGLCQSACGLILILPHDQVCVEPTASIGFHLASIGDDPDVEYTEAMIRRYFPAAVIKWIAGGKPLTEKMRFMDADTIVALGIFPACS